MRNLNNLATFVKVATYESVTEASKKLHLTQQAVSHQISKLEDELGVRLFKRAHKKIYLTQEGKFLFKAAQKHLSALESDLFQVKSDGNTIQGSVKIGTTMELATLILAPLISSFKLAHPQVHIELELQDDTITVQNIINGVSDLGIVVFSSEEQLLDIIPFQQETFITIASKGFVQQYGPFNSFKDVIESHIIDYRESCPSMQTWINKNDKKWVNQLKLKKASIAANDDRLIKQFVMSHLGIANVPKTLFLEELKQGSVVEILPNTQATSAYIDIISMRDRVLPSQVSAFVEHLTKHNKSA